MTSRFSLGVVLAGAATVAVVSTLVCPIGARAASPEFGTNLAQHKEQSLSDGLYAVDFDDVASVVSDVVTNGDGSYNSEVYADYYETDDSLTVPPLERYRAPRLTPKATQTPTPSQTVIVCSYKCPSTGSYNSMTGLCSYSNCTLQSGSNSNCPNPGNISYPATGPAGARCPATPTGKTWNIRITITAIPVAPPIVLDVENGDITRVSLLQ